MRKFLAILSWVFRMSKNVFGFVTAPFIMPLVYLYLGGKDGQIKRSNLLWYYYDDEDGFFGTDWFRVDKGYDLATKWNRFRCAYHWLALRNPAWNLHTTVKAPVGKVNIVSIEGDLWQDFKRVDLMEFASLKYVNNVGTYTDNLGEYLSIKYSKIGWTNVWYEVNGKLYFRRSFANRRRGYLIEFHIGTSDHREVLRLKIRKEKKVYELLDL